MKLVDLMISSENVIDQAFNEVAVALTQMLKVA
jgi:hypothetical protein